VIGDRAHPSEPLNPLARPPSTPDVFDWLLTRTAIIATPIIAVIIATKPVMTSLLIDSL
jgi:hypothetical protein